MLSDAKARDYMTTNILTFKVETEIFDAMNQLLDHRLSGAPVVDDGGYAIGMLTERDCLKCALDVGYNDGMVDSRVGDYMTHSVDAVGPEWGIIDVAAAFVEKNRKQMPVVENRRVLGQISRRNTLLAIKDVARHLDKVDYT